MKQNSTKNWLKGSAKYIALCCALFAGTASYAQAPANDECTGAVSLPVNTNGICTQTAGTTIAATTSAQSMPCATNSNPDVWYTFTALNTQQTITLSSFSSSAFADVGVYSGTCPAGLTLLSCTPTAGTVTATGLTIGTTYYLRVRTPAQNFNVCVGAPVPPPPVPANDECAGAISVPVNSNSTCTQTVAGTMVNATPSTNAMTCLPAGFLSDVWFSFTAGGTAHNISTTTLTASDSRMIVYGGSCSGLTEVYCGNPNANVGGLTAGNTYYVRIVSNLSTATFNICINTPVFAANDECAGAISVPVNPGTTCVQNVTGTGASASTSTNPTTCNSVGAYGDLWYSFTAAAARHIISSTVAGYLAIYSGSCGALTQVSCNFTGDTLNNLTVGSTYYVRYMILSADSFNLCITTPPPPPANDECAGAIPAPVNAGTTCTQTTASSTIGYTTSAEPMSCGNTSFPDVWYTFTATSTQHTIALSGFSNANPSGNIVVYSGTCAALTQVSCFTGFFTNISSTVTGLTVGTTYYLRIGSPAQNFNVCITTPPPPAPANDECAGAVPAAVNADATCTQTTAGTTIGATESAESMSCATNFNPDVWYTFVASDTTENITVSSLTVNPFANIGVYSGTCSSLVQLACSAGPSTSVTGLTVGATYYLRVRTQAQNFTLCISAPPPPITNDECAGAISIPVNAGPTCTQTLAATMSGATSSSNPMSCAPSGALADVWFTFTASSTTHNISAPPLTASDSRITVYSGNCAGLTEMYCFIDPNTTLSGLTVGSTYYIRLLSATTNAFNICITTPAPPALVNDECAGAITVPVNADATCTQTTVGTTVAATPSADTMTCVSTGLFGDVWFSFTATSTFHDISISGLPSGGGAGMVVYGGTCGALSEVSCTTVSTTTVSGLTVGNTYYVRVLTTPVSTFTICVSTPPAPPLNDECAGAISVPVNPNTTCSQTVAGTTTSTTPSAEAICGITPNPFMDVWFTFIATDTAHIISTPELNASNSIMAVYGGACGALTEMYCGVPNDTVSGLTAGNTYYVRIATAAPMAFTMCVTTESVVLPVTMSQLKGNITSGKATLEWNTYSEQLNKGFDVMRSEDGKTFRPVGWVSSKAANGNSSALIAYTFTDPQTLTGQAFYQLRQVDMDGKTALSNIISLSADQSNNVAMRVYPNPVKNLLNIDISGKTGTDNHVMITDLMGKVLINHTLSSNTATIDLGALPAGVYLVKYTNSTTSAIQKIVKK